MALLTSTGAGAGGPASSVALVMMDTRMPDALMELASAPEVSLKYNVSTVHLTYYLNLKYACTHGYALLFYQLTSEGCEHPLWGHRHPSYCKSVPLQRVLGKRKQTTHHALRILAPR